MGGWKVVALSEVCTIRPPKKEAREKLEPTDLVSFVPMSNLQILRRDLILNAEKQLKDVSGTYTYFADNDVLLAKITPCFENGKVGIARNLKNGIGFGSSEYFVFRAHSEIIPEYLFYFFTQDRFRDEGVRVMKGAVGHKRVPKEFVETYPIPLPPLPEQQRIVAILDEAFAAIDTATANAERNLVNARELFESILDLVFNQNVSGPNGTLKHSVGKSVKPKNKDKDISVARVSKTRGRAATDRIIPGELALSVGQPPIIPRKGWKWSRLTDIAQLESGHTPSRRHPEYWSGTIPWIGIKDARNNHGQIITETMQMTNALGLENSAARLLPSGTVCLSRTASVGYVVVMGQDMATSQDFVNWICSSEIDPHFLKYVFIAESDGFLKYSSGSVHQTIYFPEVKAFHVCHPSIEIQHQLVKYLNSAKLQVDQAEQLYVKKLDLLAELKQSLLQKAFSGELTGDVSTPS